MNVLSARYKADGPNGGWIQIILEEEVWCVGEGISGGGARKARRRREIVLKVESNIADLSGLVPCERDLVLPVVVRVLEDLKQEAAQGAAGDEEAAH